ncbi:MAG: class I SAM-dependent methyltransferase [bacterium]|nr:class I SAM-dependent methyltransferase [bacterium]
MISSRLISISKYTKGYNLLLDVGSDHGLLPIYAINNNYVKDAIASDINFKPLIKAKENFKKYNLDIKTIIYDGIPKTNADCIVIAGMGSELIIQILEKTLDNAKNLKRLILCPNTDYEMLRTYINHKFNIVFEEVIYDKNHYYEIIVLEKGDSNYNEYELYFGPVLLKTRSKEFINKLEKDLKTLKNIVNGITDLIKKENVEKEIKMIEEILCQDTL